MKNQAVRDIKKIPFHSEDTLVIFGEVFEGGYVNGLIQQAKAKGMKVIYSTVGRRTPEGALRSLTAEELEKFPKPLINVPLSAGFDQQKNSSGKSPIDLCQDIKLQDWEQARLNKEELFSAKAKASSDFRIRVQAWLKELKKILPEKGNVLIAHIMAGGVPKAKILLPILNRVLKGHGRRFSSSEVFWNSDLGWFCRENFNEVTANTYHHLLELSADYMTDLNKQNRRLFFTAYSYHGTEVLIEDEYQWQSYAPYLQGFAKIELENISQKYFNKGYDSSVFNVPEILTPSSSIFPGVEIPLYPILGALNKEGGQKSRETASQHEEKLEKDSLFRIMDITTKYFQSDIMKPQRDFKQWPRHNTDKQMELMINTSNQLASLHKNKKSQNITASLSRIVLQACGRLILQEIQERKQAVCWLGHDVIVRDITARG